MSEPTNSAVPLQGEPQPTTNVGERPCDCPPGAWHLRTCTAVYWPDHMREDDDALLDERETA